TLKAIFFADFPEWLGLSLYLALGWLGAISIGLLWLRFGYRFVRPLILGGLAYSIGAVMEYLEFFALIPHVVEYHELFHVMVLVGAGCPFAFVWRIACTPRMIDHQVDKERAETVPSPPARGHKNAAEAKGAGGEG